jgi:hypothetical protein
MAGHGYQVENGRSGKFGADGSLVLMQGKGAWWARNLAIVHWLSVQGNLVGRKAEFQDRGARLHAWAIGYLQSRGAGEKSEALVTMKSSSQDVVRVRDEMSLTAQLR